MQSAQSVAAKEAHNRTEQLTEVRYETWAHWPVNWSAIWVGTLASIAAVVVFGLIGIAVGAYIVGTGDRVVDMKQVGLFTLGFSVVSAFLSFVIGGWVAGKIAGILRSEPAMLHGAIVWLVAGPLLVGLATLGASSYLGGWYSGLAGNPAWASPAVAPFDRPDPLPPNASEDERAQYRNDLRVFHQKAEQWREESPRVARNSALGAVTALLLGLIGSVIGGWMACGEPMTFTYHRTRPASVSGRQEQSLVHV